MALKLAITIGAVLFLQILGMSDGSMDNYCKDTTYHLGNSVTTLKSPLYPQKYPSGSACQYMLVAPLDYEITVKCRIRIDKHPNECSTEHFYISRDGNTNSSGADQFCGSKSVKRSSLFRTLVLGYVSGAAQNSSVGGTFLCRITTRAQDCDCGWSQNKRITGGTETSINEYPSMVGLLSAQKGVIFCGGSIISHSNILTAAHCVENFNIRDLVIVVGEHNVTTGADSKYTKLYRVENTIQHPHYNAPTNANNIAIIRIIGNMEWSLGVGPICLPLDQSSNTFANKIVDIVGWGASSFSGDISTTLQKASLKVLSNSECKQFYPNLVSSQMCTYAKNKGPCQIDDGGPCVYKSTRQFLLGINTDEHTCGENINVNERITSSLNWIQSFDLEKLCSKPFM